MGAHIGSVLAVRRYQDVGTTMGRRSMGPPGATTGYCHVGPRRTSNVDLGLPVARAMLVKASIADA
jgi:hypothetical protein